MAEEQPSLHIDTDWKKQAQEEKRKLAEQEQKRTADREAAKASTPTPMAPDVAGGMPTSAGTSPASRTRGGAVGARGERQIPEASFATLVNSLMTQVLL